MMGRGFAGGALALGAMLMCAGAATAADAPKQVTFSKDVARFFKPSARNVISQARLHRCR